MLGAKSDVVSDTVIRLVFTGPSQGTHREPEGEIRVDWGDKPRGAGTGHCTSHYYLFWPTGSDGKDFINPPSKCVTSGASEPISSHLTQCSAGTCVDLGMIGHVGYSSSGVSCRRTAGWGRHRC